jgi:N-acetyl-anhydromuramyl-L-alanine amidase AmpD
VKNIIQSQLSEADRTKINGLIAEIEAALAGKTGTLSADERKRYGSVNEQNKLVVNKAREYRQTQPAMSAPDVDWDEFESDYQARAFLETCINRLSGIMHALESTKIMHDYDNFQDALKDYGYAQYQFGSGEETYAPKVSEFKQFFSKTKPTPPADGGGDGETPP